MIQTICTIDTPITKPTPSTDNRGTRYPFEGQALLLHEVADRKEISISTLFGWKKKHGWKKAFAMTPSATGSSADRPRKNEKNPDLETASLSYVIKNIIVSLSMMGLLGPRVEVIEEIQKRMRF